MRERKRESTEGFSCTCVTARHRAARSPRTAPLPPAQPCAAAAAGTRRPTRTPARRRANSPRPCIALWRTSKHSALRRRSARTSATTSTIAGRRAACAASSARRGGVPRADRPSCRRRAISRLSRRARLAGAGARDGGRPPLLTGRPSRCRRSPRWRLSVRGLLIATEQARRSRSATQQVR